MRKKHLKSTIKLYILYLSTILLYLKGVFGDYMGNDLFAKRLKELRNSKNLTMAQLANELNKLNKDFCIQKSRISMWENNGVVPRQEVLFELAKFFNVSTDYLLGLNVGNNLKSEKITSIQRNYLEKLDEEGLDRIEKIISDNFEDLFNDK